MVKDLSGAWSSLTGFWHHRLLDIDSEGVSRYLWWVGCTVIALLDTLGPVPLHDKISKPVFEPCQSQALTSTSNILRAGVLIMLPDSRCLIYKPDYSQFLAHSSRALWSDFLIPSHLSAWHDGCLLHFSSGRTSTCPHSPSNLIPQGLNLKPACPSDQERAYLLIDVLEQDGCMVDEFAHEMAANTTQDWTRNHTRQEFVGWLEELVAANHIPPLLLATPETWDTPARPSICTASSQDSGSWSGAPAGGACWPLLPWGPGASKHFEPEILQQQFRTWNLVMFLDLPSAQEGKTHLDHSLQLVDFLQELSRSVSDAVAMAGNYLRPEARLGLSSLRFKMIRFKKLRFKMPTAIELSVPDFCQVLEAPMPIYLPLWRTCWPTCCSSWTARLQQSGGSVASQMSGITS